MATKKKVTTKRAKRPSARSTPKVYVAQYTTEDVKGWLVPDITTPAGILSSLHGLYTFGAAVDRQIAEVLRKAALAAKREDKPRDPLLDPPQFIHPDFDRAHQPFVERASNAGYADRIIWLGEVDTYNARILHSTMTHETIFKWGCARETSEVNARRHWRNNQSTASGFIRPGATALIDYVAKVCKFRGWQW